MPHPFPRRSPLRAFAAAGLMALAPTLPVAAQPAAVTAEAAAASAPQDFSPSEKALFMAPHLAGVKPPATIRYRFERSGSMDPALAGPVVLHLKPKAGAGGCCAAEADFLEGAEKLSLPVVDEAVANPIIMYFLERDVREMNRLTKGQAAYFRKRIRLAIFEGATIERGEAGFAGRRVPTQTILIQPYRNDPLEQRFKGLHGKRYEFVLSDQVPGGVLSMRAWADGEAGKPLLWQQSLTLLPG